MRQHLKKSVCVSMILGGVTACGGGGGGEPGWISEATDFASWSTLPSNGSVAASGEARTAVFKINPNTLAVTTSGASGRQDAVAAALLESSDIVALHASSSGLTITLDERYGAKNLSDFDVLNFESSDGSSVIILLNPDSSGYDYHTFGSWARLDDTSITSAFGSFGAETASGALPSPSNTVSYSGYSVGEAVDGSGNFYVTEGVITLTTDDFVTIELAATDTQALDLFGISFVDAPELDVSGTLTVSGGQFSGPVGTTYVSGTASGSFYGPSAEEAGGTFSAAGSGWTYLGAYGTEQVATP